MEVFIRLDARSQISDMSETDYVKLRPQEKSSRAFCFGGAAMEKELSKSGMNIVGMDTHIKAPVGQASMKMHKGKKPPVKPMKRIGKSAK